MFCDCSDSALPTIAKLTCEQIVGEAWRFAFQKTFNGSALNEIVVATDAPSAKDTWTSLQAATDATKVVFTPLIDAPNHEVPDPQTYGGPGQTRGGLTRILRGNYSTYTSEIHNCPSDILVELKKLKCPKLSVFIVAEDGTFYGIENADGTKWRGIPIENFFLGSKKIGGSQSPDMNRLSFQLAPNWEHGLKGYAPAAGFNPNLEL